MNSISLLFKTLKTAVEPRRADGPDRSNITDTCELQRSAAGSSALDGCFQDNLLTTPQARPPKCISLYCEKYHIRPDQFAAAVFWKTLYPRARLFGFLAIWLFPREFTPDRDFIDQVGQVENMEQYGDVEEGFRRWPSCRSFLRGKLGLRVTSRRVRRLVDELFAPVAE